VWQKEWIPKVFRRFLSNRIGFQYEVLQFYLLKPFTSNCQVKCDSVEKRRRHRLFNMTAYRFFSIKNVQAKNPIYFSKTGCTLLPMTSQ